MFKFLILTLLLPINLFAFNDSKLHTFNKSLINRCPYHICVGDRVIDNNDFPGKVIELFNNDKIKVHFDGYSSKGTIRSVNGLYKSYRCNYRYKICVNDRVIDRNNYSGKVIEVFHNGKTRIHFDGFSSKGAIRNAWDLTL